MKRIIPIVALITLPAFAMASGGHATEHHEHASSGSSMAGGDHEGDHETVAGQAGDPAKVTRTVEVTMDDSMRFTPDKLNFKAGETVRFVIRNKGKIRHEMVIGSMDELNEHAEMMRTMPTMKHAETNMISLAPGDQGRLVWQFGQPGTLDFACLVPGHREAGMTGEIKVNPGRP